MLANLPSRNELIAKLLYLMKYPISGLAVALEGVRKQKAGE
jgi:large subunit ribosomal protein L10